MKKSILILFVFIVTTRLFGQGVDCGSADPFCTGTTYDFPASVDVTSPDYGTYPNYGCLCSMPNPAWYYMQIGNPGNLVIHISTSPANDVDFICWGPFASPTAACTNQLTGNCTDCFSGCPSNVDNPTFYPSGNITDCSYSIYSTEDCYINNALTGQYYILLITNYSDQPCNIIFSQSNAGQAGAGTTNCGILPTPIGNNGPICVGDTLKLTAMTVANANYSWSGPNGFTSFEQNPIIPNATAAMSGYYSCLVMIGAQLSPEDSTLVTVNPRPTVTAVSDTICNGNTATLTASGASTYSWNPSGSTTNPLLTNPTITTNYTVIGKNTFGCADTAYATVIVNPGPSISVNSTNICVGDAATLTASGAATYVWTNPPLTTNPIIVTPSLTTTYTVTGTDINNCVGTATATVTVGTPPVIQISNDTTICAGTNVTLTASGGANYLWSGPGGNQTTPSISVSPTTITTYLVEVTDASGCKNDTTITVKVTPLPIPFLSLTSDTICRGASTVLTATGGSTYLWNTGETTPDITIKPINTTTYTVTVSNDVNGVICYASASIAQNVRNCNTIFIPNAFSPYGHNSIFRPMGNIANTADYNLQIWDRWGQLIFETTNTEVGWDGTYKGELSPVGVYVYHLRIDDKLNPVYETVGTVTLIK